MQGALGARSPAFLEEAHMGNSNPAKAMGRRRRGECSERAYLEDVAFELGLGSTRDCGGR